MCACATAGAEASSPLEMFPVISLRDDPVCRYLFTLAFIISLAVHSISDTV